MEIIKVLRYLQLVENLLLNYILCQTLTLYAVHRLPTGWIPLFVIAALLTAYLFHQYHFRDALTVDFPPRPVRNGDIIQIVHGVTGRALNR